MKFKELIAKTEKLFHAAKREKKIKKDSLRKLAGKLEKYEEKKEKKLDDEDDPEAREHLEKKIRLARAQRKKALALIKKLGGDDDDD